MGYFRELPNLLYPSFLSEKTSSLDYIEVKNIFRRVKVRDDLYKNFVVFRDDVYLIDWEHASMGDPYFDFADFCQQNALDHIDSLPKQCCTQFHHSRSFDAEKFILFYLLSMLTWGLWSVQKNRPAKSHELLTKAIHRSKNHI